MNKEDFLRLLSAAILGAARVNIVDEAPLFEMAIDFHPFSIQTVDELVIHPFISSLMSHQAEHKAAYLTLSEFNGRIAIRGMRTDVHSQLLIEVMQTKEQLREQYER